MKNMAQDIRYKVQGSRLRVQDTRYKGQGSGFGSGFDSRLPTPDSRLLSGSRLPVVLLMLFALPILFSSCYSFKDVSIPPEVKTFRVNYIENRARYINPQLSPQLTDKLRQKIMNQTRLSGVQTEDAHYDISATITGYDVVTAAISQQQASINRLSVTVHVMLKNNIDDTKSFEADVSRNFDFSANLSLQQAEAQLTESIIQNMVDEMFNRIFSNW